MRHWGGCDERSADDRAGSARDARKGANGDGYGDMIGISARLLLAIALTAVVATPARATIAEDCTQSDDWALKARGCTAVIQSGQWKGADLMWAYSNRALAQQHLGNVDAAFQDIDKALELDPKDYRALNIRGHLRARLGHRSGAARDFALSFELGGVEFIRSWQEYLKYHGHYDAAVDGVYGPIMEQSMFDCSRNIAC